MDILQFLREHNSTIQKVGFSTAFVGWVVQTTAMFYLIKKYDEFDEDYKALYNGFNYLIEVAERENLELTEFDVLAFEALKPDKRRKKGK